MVAGFGFWRSETSTSTFTFPWETIARFPLEQLLDPHGSRKAHRHTSTFLEPRLPDGEPAVSRRHLHIEENPKSLFDQEGHEKLAQEEILENSSREGDAGNSRGVSKIPRALQGRAGDGLVKNQGKRRNGV